MSDKKSAFNYEKSLTELEQLVAKMEKGDLPLEDSLAYFEQGVDLVKTCQHALSQADQKVKQLIEKQGEVELIDFNPTDSDDAV